MVNAIILAGDKSGLPGNNFESKALIKIKGRYMIQYVIDSLKRARCINKLVIVGSKSVDAAIGSSVDAVLKCEDSIIKNVRKAIDFLGSNMDVIVCTCDIPMISDKAIEDFVGQCAERGVDIGYPIIEKSLNDSKYPGARRTYVRMKDGIYTGGNIIYINPASLDKCYAMAEELVENRKNAIKMGRALGIWTLIKLSLGMLSIVSVEKRAKKLFGINARAIISRYPEIGNDVDKLDDVEFVNKYISA